MILNIDATSNSGAVRGNDGEYVTIGGMEIRDGKFSEEVEFTGATGYGLLISDGTGGHGNGVVWMDDGASLVNTGNGRTYLFRDGIVEQLGAGGEDEDAVTGLAYKLQEGDILLICSEGLVDVVNDDYLEYFLMSSASPAEELAEWAMENGSTDNISVIAARVGGGMFGDGDEVPDDDGRFDAWA